jgi:AraC-like DNA-binding protein
VLLFGVALALLYRHRKRAELPPAGGVSTIGQRITQMSDLMARIQTLMEEQELFKKTDLKVEDIAEELGTNAAYVRQCITGAYGGSFKNFVNEYRIRYVQQLKKHPDAKITALALDAGFSSTATFYRNFTSITGQSPAAWLKESKK